ncbi:Metallothionein-like protein [Plasmopara halstedii]|uniref:Metallothionein-like protein n=1 Tax=Plasmopara halstedii TaxID=4781 RepID=A0A0P1AHF6_PLAHL|nr:Metallothionein-like protein [Plasmopara halstedii]CEG40653.1 Metallothionein-like protein [Plasmopara halstedii]|eukprot:XP_024577022.1 Metallothionein-like protein [Plasmopara halstedii]
MQENREPIEALESASQSALKTEEVKSLAPQLRRVLHSIDSNRPRPEVNVVRRSMLNKTNQTLANGPVIKKALGQVVTAKTSETSDKMMVGLKRPVASASDEVEELKKLKVQFTEQDSENLAWMDMMLALLEKRYGPKFVLPVCLTDLEAANLFNLPQIKHSDVTEKCIDSKDGSMSVVSATNLPDIPETPREIKRQRVLQRHAQQIHTSSVSSSMCCGCKTGCLKMYCMCFSSRGFCHTGCTCFSCKNGRKHQTERVEAIQNYLSNDPRAFSFASLSQDTRSLGFLHLLPQKSSAVVMRGCRCKKSKCSKKYCECFQNGIACTPLCRCMECSNNSESKIAHQQPQLQRSSASSSSVPIPATNVKQFHPVHITVTKQPRRNHVGKSLRLNL